jgi:hypothetical protein
VTTPADESAPVLDLRVFAHDLCDHLSPISNSVGLIRLIPDLDRRITRALDVIDRQTGALLKMADQLRPQPI